MSNYYIQKGGLISSFFSAKKSALKLVFEEFRNVGFPLWPAVAFKELGEVYFLFEQLKIEHKDDALDIIEQTKVEPEEMIEIYSPDLSLPEDAKDAINFLIEIGMFQTTRDVADFMNVAELGDNFFFNYRYLRNADQDSILKCREILSRYFKARTYSDAIFFHIYNKLF